MTYEELRKQYPVFEFNKAEIRTAEQDGCRYLTISYGFMIPGMEQGFTPSWQIPLPKGCSEAEAERFVSDPYVIKTAFALGMTELVSYWKCACPPSVVVRAGALDEEEIRWFRKLYYHGLGEFFYTNGIDAQENDFMKITVVDSEDHTSEDHTAEDRDRNDHDLKDHDPNEENGSETQGEEVPKAVLSGALIPVGGGKDSVVTMELLKDLPENRIFMINPRGANRECSLTAGYEEDTWICPRRRLDPFLLELNRRGFLNGHTPFSAIVAFSSVLCAYVNGKKYVALSNESSANESTVAGSTVNHQYSKSFEFERDFDRYNEAKIGCGVKYFSMLRPLSEFQIAGLFSGYPKYHPVFKSCNVGSKQDVWCGKCPKCMFVYMILSPFLSQEELVSVFGRNMLEDPEMLPVMKELIGVSENKPFECVGSRSEVNAAAVLCIEKRLKEGKELPLLYRIYREEYGAILEEYRDAWKQFRDYYDGKHLIPEELEPLLRKELKQWQARMGAAESDGYEDR